jgi:hypothetical protein
MNLLKRIGWLPLALLAFGLLTDRSWAKWAGVVLGVLNLMGSQLTSRLSAKVAEVFPRSAPPTSGDVPPSGGGSFRSTC